MRKGEKMVYMRDVLYSFLGYIGVFFLISSIIYAFTDAATETILIRLAISAVGFIGMRVFEFK